MSDDPAFVSEPSAQIDIAPTRLVAPRPTPVFRELRELRESDPPADVAPLADVELTVSLELGRAEVTLRDALAMARGTVIELDKRAGDPVDVVVNGMVVARGEVVVVDERFAVRITQVLNEG
jgi:flagellar motor switch protein FliN/FliY